MYKLSQLEKVHIMFSYQHEFPMKSNSKLNDIIEKIRPQPYNFQWENIQITLARMVILDFKLPTHEVLLEDFVMKNDKKINYLFKRFLSLYCAKEYTESFVELLEKNHLESEIKQIKDEQKNKIKL